MTSLTKPISNNAAALGKISFINVELKNTKASQQDLNELLIKFTILHGQLMDVINSAKNPEGHKGEQISAVEKKEIFDAFESLENKILKIKTTIERS